MWLSGTCAAVPGRYCLDLAGTIEADKSQEETSREADQLPFFLPLPCTERMAAT
jgi:hypothetical protein